VFLTLIHKANNAWVVHPLAANLSLRFLCRASNGQYRQEACYCFWYWVSKCTPWWL